MSLPSHYIAQKLYNLFQVNPLQFEEMINEAQSKLFGKELFKVDSLKEV